MYIHFDDYTPYKYSLSEIFETTINSKMKYLLGHPNYSTKPKKITWVRTHLGKLFMNLSLEYTKYHNVLKQLYAALVKNYTIHTKTSILNMRFL